MKKILKSLFFIFATLTLVTLATNAYFTDQASVTSNYFSTGLYNPEPQPGDIIINEIMWMGSKDLGNPARDGATDQWIELKSVADHDLHKKGLYLTAKTNAGGTITIFTIGDNRDIKPGEFYLATHYTKQNSAINVNPDGTGMDNFEFGKMQIKLWFLSDTPGSTPVLIDVAGDGINSPSKGDATNFYSMQRNNMPGAEDGTNYANWNTCIDASTTLIYWDLGRVERGTPAGQNI